MPERRRAAPARARPSRAGSGRPRRRQPARQARPARLLRWQVVYDIEGPRVRLGILWFVLALTAVVVGPYPAAVVYGLAAALAGLQSAAALRAAGLTPDRRIAPVAAGVLPVAAAFSTGLLGLAILGATLVSLWAATTETGAAGPEGLIATGSATIRCWLFAGGAAASVVLTERYSAAAAITLVLLVSAYESGDYIVGSGARSALEGPLAGALSILVVAFGVTALDLEPFEFPDGFVLGAMAAVLCPLGQLAASAVLPAPDAFAPALRRLDSLLLLGPVWAFVIGRLVES